MLKILLVLIAIAPVFCKLGESDHQKLVTTAYRDRRWKEGVASLYETIGAGVSYPSRYDGLDGAEDMMDV